MDVIRHGSTGWSQQIGVEGLSNAVARVPYVRDSFSLSTDPHRLVGGTVEDIGGPVETERQSRPSH